MSEAGGDRIRVAFIIGSLELGGAERQLVRLVNHLDRSKFQPSIVCWFGGGALEGEVAADVPVVNLSLRQVAAAAGPSKVVLALRILRSLRRELKRLRPDLVNAYMFTAYVLGSLAARSVGVPAVIASRRGLVSYRTYPKQWWLMARLADRAIDLHLCNSEAVRRWAEEHEGIPRARTAVIYNGVDLPPAGRAPSLPRELRRRPPAALAAMIANFHAYKGHPVLLEAVAKVAAVQPGFRVVLFGDGDRRPHLEEQVERLGIAGNVVMAGARKDAAGFLPAFDFSILTSSEEGFPNVVIESMAAGVPVVATAVGGVPELITDGVEGRLVPAGDPAALAKAMLWMAEHAEQRRLMGAAGRERVGRELSVERMVKSTESLFLDLLGRRAPARVRMLEGAA